MSSEQLQKILTAHKEWLIDNTKGRRADLGGADLREANLYGAYLYGADLREANLYGANLSGANLIGAYLYGADLREANLYGAYLYGANLREANLYGANLREANLYGANLSGANLIGANLYGADLREAYLSGANLSGANLREANLSGADLPHTDVFIFTLGQHFGFAHFGEQYESGSYVKIGCEEGSLDYWLENFESIGNKHNYTKAQIATYGKMLNMLNLIKLESDLAKMETK